MKRLLKSTGNRIVGHIGRFIRNHRGVAMAEFALMLPVLMLLTAGSFEVARYALMTQKLDRIAATPGWKHPYDLMPGNPSDRA